MDILICTPLQRAIFTCKKCTGLIFDVSVDVHGCAPTSALFNHRSIHRDLLKKSLHNSSTIAAEGVVERTGTNLVTSLHL